jgi:hypothetical protein
VIVAAGFAFTNTEVGNELVEQPAAVVIDTVIVELVVTLMLDVVAPVDQRYVLPDTTGLAFKVTEPP